MFTVVAQSPHRRNIPDGRCSGNLFPSVFTPGGWLISPVDQTNYVETLAVLAKYPSLAHVTAMAAAISMLLYGYGLLGLRSIPGSKFSSLLQYGVSTSLFGWGIFRIAMGKRHRTVHLMQRSVESSGDPVLQSLLFDAALNVYADMAGLILAFLNKVVLFGATGPLPH